MHEIGNTAIRSLAGYVPWYRYMYVATYVEKSGGSLDVGITGKYGTNCSQTQFCFSGLFFGTVDRTASGQMHVGILSATQHLPVHMCVSTAVFSSKRPVVWYRYHGTGTSNEVGS